MIIDHILAMFTSEVRNSDAMRALVALSLTYSEQLQSTQEQLTKALDKIKVLEDEIAKLRKTPKRPKFSPNNMQPRERNKGSSKPNPMPLDNGPSLALKEVSEIIVKPENIPVGSRFKGHQTFTVQEINIIAKEITYKLEVWHTPTGEVLRGKIPTELKGQHFGPTLRALETNLYAQGMSQPAIHEFLGGLGIEISSGQVNNILLNEAEGYSKTSEAILTAGLEEAPYIRTDDTGEKHQHKSGYCTHIGGEYFAYYKTSFSKSRENFLKILLQGKEGYRINDSMIWHLFQCGVEDDVLNLFENYKGKSYETKKGIKRLLNGLGLKAKKIRQQCIEAGLVGYITTTILKQGQILMSDRAGQFALFDHAACWIHMERPLRKIICTSREIENQLKGVRNAIWTIYKKLREAVFTGEDKAVVNQLYDDLVKMKTGSSEINDVIANFKAFRDELLKVLDHPGIPLHNNDSERDIRPVAKRRNISGSTKSDLGRKFRDGLMGIKQTCFRVGYNFWDYLQRWHRGDPPDLSKLVRHRYQTSAT
ncbi:MAG: transposase [Parachlamydiaceae bacterium]|nr:transposase [Parachlamydiaceae bacterium]